MAGNQNTGKRESPVPAHQSADAPTPNADLLSKRPDLIDLIGPEFDRVSPEPARRTLIVCASPRTGSYELCRYLTAAGVGVPHEYFNAKIARRLAERWDLGEHPLTPDGLSLYIDTLRRRRAQNGVFATKLFAPQFEDNLRNRQGAALLKGACFVHLYRTDPATQYASFRAAMESGTWDFSSRQTSPPRRRPREDPKKYQQQAVKELTMLMRQDMDFRVLFVLLGIRPIFVTSEGFFRDPRIVVRRIAQAVRVPVNEEALERAIAASAGYGHRADRERAVAGLAEGFREMAFRKKRKPRSAGPDQEAGEVAAKSVR
jgi:LPS sulfotransferase NodH